MAQLTSATVVLLTGMGGDGRILHGYPFSGSSFVALCYRKVVCVPKAYRNGWLLSGEEVRSFTKLLRKWLFWNTLQQNHAYALTRTKPENDREGNQNKIGKGAFHTTAAHEDRAITASTENEKMLHEPVSYSREWFDWLATLSSYRFVGQSSRFTAYRERGHGQPTRCWVARRCSRNRYFKHWLAVTDQLSIARLEQIAAGPQAYVDAL